MSLLWIFLLAAMVAQAQVRKSDDLVNSIGINVHWGYDNTPYYQRYDEVSTLLGESGIRFIRDRIDDKDWRRKLDWYDRYGIRLLAFADAQDRAAGTVDLSAVPGLLDVARDNYGPKRLVGIMGVNEWDLSRNTDKELKPSSVWVEEWRRVQQEIYDYVKQDAVLQQLHVLMGPLAFDNNIKLLGDVSGMADLGADHPYPGNNRLPSEVSSGKPRPVQSVVDQLQQAVGNTRPVWFSESGYRQPAPGGTLGNKDVTAKARAKYLPRMIANHFGNPNIAKTFLYELLSSSPTNPWGILNYDLTKTASYHTVKNLISLCAEATWDTGTQRWIGPPAYPLVDLDYTLEGDLTNVQRLLLQKSDGTYVLLLWQEVASYDPVTRKDIDPAARNITFALNGRQASSIKEYRLYNEANPAATFAPVRTRTQLARLTVGVPDHVVALEIKPAILQGTFQLLARHSGKALAVDLNSTTNGGFADPTISGTNVFQYGSDTYANRLWNIEAVGQDGYYTLTSAYSGKALAVDLNPLTNGGFADLNRSGPNIFQYGNNTDDNRLWKVESVGEGYYKLTNKYSGRVLDVAGRSTEDGANVLQWNYNGGANQQWQLLAVDATAAAKLPATAQVQLVTASADASTIAVYPNPVSDRLTVAGERPYQLALHDATGRLFLQQLHAGGTTGLDVSHLPAGMYTLSLAVGGEVLHRYRVVKE